MSDTTNPKDAIGSAKLPLHLWPVSATAYGSLALLDGASKYGRNNWRATPVRASVYVAAALRHLAAYAEGQDRCPASKLPHLGHALACLAILADAGAAGTLVDDRNYPGGYETLAEELAPLVPMIQAAYAGRDEPKHYTIADALPAAG